MRIRLRRSVCVALGALALSSGLLTGQLRAQSAFANIGACMDDPVLTLSDGTTVRLTVTIGTNVAHVQAIVYTVDLPANLTVTTVKYPTAEKLRDVSLVVINENNSAGSGLITTDAIVTSNAHNAAVTVNEQVKNNHQNVDWQAQVSGLINQDLTITYPGSTQANQNQPGHHVV